MQRYISYNKFNKKILCILILFVIIYTMFGTFPKLINKSYAATYTYKYNSTNTLPKNFDTTYPGYKSAIEKLAKAHPNWTFKLYETGLVWDTVINNEYLGHGESPKNLSPSNYPKGWICTICNNKAYDNGTWRCTSRNAIEYMIDPRNSINEDDLFQFQELSYSNTNNSNYTIDSKNKYIIVDPTKTIKSIEGAKNSSNVFGTGAKITLKDTTYSLVMLGDCNGDGVINSGDLLALKKHLLGTQVISDKAKKEASDANCDEGINSGDLLAVKKHLLGTAKILNIGTPIEKKAIEKMVEGTFIDSTECVNAIFAAANQHKVSPYHIVSRIIQEQGAKGSTLGLGIKSDGKTYYNVFNIGAYGNTSEKIIANGLLKAKEEGWTSIGAAIIGGTEFLAKNYISLGQNTLYFQKFNVVNKNNLYGNQYMQNVLAAQNEGTSIRSKYIKYGILESPYTFVIPLYNDMPSKACAKPSDTSVKETGQLAYINVNSESTLSLRDSPNGKIIANINANAEVLITKEGTQKIDGTYWDKVSTSKGTGYMARTAKDGSKTYLVKK